MIENKFHTPKELAKIAERRLHEIKMAKLNTFKEKFNESVRLAAENGDRKIEMIISDEWNDVNKSLKYRSFPFNMYKEIRYHNQDRLCKEWKEFCNDLKSLGFTIKVCDYFESPSYLIISW